MAKDYLYVILLDIIFSYYILLSKSKFRNIESCLRKKKTIIFICDNCYSKYSFYSVN